MAQRSPISSRSMVHCPHSVPDAAVVEQHVSSTADAGLGGLAPDFASPSIRSAATRKISATTLRVELRSDSTFASALRSIPSARIKATRVRGNGFVAEMSSRTAADVSMSSAIRSSLQGSRGFAADILAAKAATASLIALRDFIDSASKGELRVVFLLEPGQFRKRGAREARIRSNAPMCRASRVAARAGLIHDLPAATDILVKKRRHAVHLRAFRDTTAVVNSPDQAVAPRDRFHKTSCKKCRRGEAIHPRPYLRAERLPVKHILPAFSLL